MKESITNNCGFSKPIYKPVVQKGSFETCLGPYMSSGHRINATSLDPKNLLLYIH